MDAYNELKRKFPNNRWGLLELSEHLRAMDSNSFSGRYDVEEIILGLYPATQGVYISLDNIPSGFWDIIKEKSIGIAKGERYSIRVYSNSDWGRWCSQISLFSLSQS